GADILVENYRPGVMDRLGLGYEALAALNPRLIYCAISGFGLTGPLSDKPSFDIVTQALTGALSINGERGHMPVKLGIPLGDMVGGIFGPMAILTAVLSESFWGKLCDALERPDLAQDPRFATPTGRRDHRDEVDRLISEVTLTRSVAEWQDRLAAFDVPHAPVLGITAALAHPHAV